MDDSIKGAGCANMLTVHREVVVSSCNRIKRIKRYRLVVFVKLVSYVRLKRTVNSLWDVHVTLSLSDWHGCVPAEGKKKREYKKKDPSKYLNPPCSA